MYEVLLPMGIDDRVGATPATASVLPQLAVPPIGDIRRPDLVAAKPDAEAAAAVECAVETVQARPRRIS